MSVAIRIRFPSGRYHATSWGHHVNEGVVDWPPSPWRLLRALVAAWHNRSRAEDDLPRAVLARLTAKMSVPPGYVLPSSWSAGHTRHYMPGGSTKANDKNLVIDSFVAVHPDEELVVQWDADLHDDEARMLDTLLHRLTYLGRAESWVEMWRGEPVEPAALVRPGEGDGEAVPLLALDPGAGLKELEQDTQTLHKRRANAPEGTRVVRYFVGRPSLPLVSRPRESRANVAVFSVRSDVPVRILDAVDVTDALRAALRSRASRDSWVLSGRGEDGRPMRGHRHAVFAAEDRAGNGRISHLWVSAAASFDEATLDAISRLREVCGGRGRSRSRGFELDLALLELGRVEAFERHPFVGPARTWVSRTPFLLNRHPKVRRGRVVDGPEDQLRRELASRGLPALLHLEPLARLERKTRRPLRWLEFRRYRRRHQPAVQEAYGFRITLEEPIHGPLTLGFGAHFGLGSFAPVWDR
ncbi:MAG TPA: type I-U CRISPR-associated protein Csb2 [Sandaracinaceae bacterium LLY-WYZ-13_1]|nr:type I-U CRISPR-associated protein Csb2 [Sandaracinaceae bacterium LLY-WYZ-13_1]